MNKQIIIVAAIGILLNVAMWGGIAYGVYKLGEWVYEEYQISRCLDHNLKNDCFGQDYE